MAILTQFPYIDENGTTYENLIKTYSNENFKIVQIETGNVYDIAVDVFPSKYTYEETNEKIEVVETESDNV